VLNIRLFSTLAVKEVIAAVSPACKDVLAIQIAPEFAPTKALMRRLAAGERPDAVVLTREGLNELVHNGLVVEKSVVDLARSYVGVAVKSGTPHPNISSVAALRRTLLQSQSVAYSRLGASGIFFADLVKQLGVADEINLKARIIEQGLTAERLLTGEADLAVQQISELKQVQGVDVVGPIPSELQTPALFSAGRLRSCKQPDGVNRFLEYLKSPSVALTLRQSGLHPIECCTK